MGVLVAPCGPEIVPELQLPKPGVRDRILLHTKLPASVDQSLFIALQPGKDHQQTQAASRQARAVSSGGVMTFAGSHGVLVINFGSAKATASLPAPAMVGSSELQPGTAGLWTERGRVF